MKYHQVRKTSDNDKVNHNFKHFSFADSMLNFAGRYKWFNPTEKTS